MIRPSIEERDLAERIVADGIATREAIEAALRERPVGQPLGVFLVLWGILTPEQLERVLFPDTDPSTRKGEVLLADALVEGKVVPRERVEEALRVQKDVPLPLGTLLVRMGSISATRLQAGAAGVPHEPIPGEPVAWSPEVVEALRDPKRRFGKYVLVEEVGRGGMGVVYRAYDALLDRQVALKMLLSDAFTPGGESVRLSATTETQVERFRREARAAGRLSHPGIIPIHEVGMQNGVHFYAMEFVEGPSLEKLLRGARLSPPLAARLLIETAEALHHSHQAGIIHRDVKPGNLLLSIAPGSVSAESTVATRLTSGPCVLDELSGRVRIADFGLARSVAAPGLTTRGDVMGTPAYMAPEQALGEVDKIDARTDVYSLGAVLYHAVTGRPPFVGEGPMQVIAQAVASDPEPPRALVPDLPRDVEVIALRAMSKEMPRRYRDAQAFADDLGRFLRGEAIHARPVGRLERASRWVRRHRALAAALLALAVVVPAGVWLGVRALLDNRALARALVHESRGVALHNEAVEAYRQPDPDWDAWKGKLEIARDAFDAALAEYPTLATSLHGRAQTNRDLGRYEESLADLDRLIAASPGFVQARIERALHRLDQVLIQVDPVYGTRSITLRSAHSHTAFPMTPAERETLALVREDLRAVAALEPDRVKSLGTPMWLLLLDGRSKEALGGVDEVLTADRNLLWARLLRARCLAGLGEAKEALGEADYFLSVRPNDEGGLLLRALVLMDLDRVQEAIAALRRLLSRYHDPEGAVRTIATLLVNHGFGEEAVEELKRGAEDPMAAWRLGGMALAHLVRRDPEAALSCAEEALRLEPGNGLFHSLRGQALLALGRADEAAAAFQAPRDAKGIPECMFHLWMAHVELARERFGEALEHASAAIAAGEEWDELHSLRGRIAWRLGRLSEAERDLARALALDPWDAPTHAHHGDVLLAMGRADDALAAYDESVRLDPKSGYAHYGRGCALARLDRNDEALAALDRAAGLSPEDAQVQRGRGNVLFRLGRYDDAAEAYRRVLASVLDDVDARMGLARCLYEASKAEEALAEVERILARDAGRKDAVRLRGKCLYELGRWEEAGRDLAASIAPDEADGAEWFALGFAELRAGDRASVEHLRKAEALTPEGPNRDRARAAREAAERKFGNR